MWPQLHIGTVITRTEKKRVVEITRTMAHGRLEQAERLLHLSSGGRVLTTASIERVHGTFRERLASLTRKRRHAASRLKALHLGMDLIGCTSHFCGAHQELRKAHHWGRACPPAMVSGLTDHVCRVAEFFGYKVAPAPWIAPKRRGRPRIRPLSDPAVPKRPRGRPRKLA